MLRVKISLILVVSILNSIMFLSLTRMSMSTLTFEKGYETTGVLNVLDDSVASHQLKTKDLPPIVGILSERETRFKLRFQVLYGFLDNLVPNFSPTLQSPINALDKKRFITSYHSSLSFLSTLLI